MRSIGYAAHAQRRWGGRGALPFVPCPSPGSLRSPPSPRKRGEGKEPVVKLASLKGGRDGRLGVVSRDLTRRADASSVALTMQAALDDWDVIAPKLRGIAEALEAGR